MQGEDLTAGYLYSPDEQGVPREGPNVGSSTLARS